MAQDGHVKPQIRLPAAEMRLDHLPTPQSEGQTSLRSALGPLPMDHQRGLKEGSQLPLCDLIILNHLIQTLLKIHLSSFPCFAIEQAYTSIYISLSLSNIVV